MKNKQQREKRLLLRFSAHKLQIPENSGRDKIVARAAMALGRDVPPDKPGKYALLSEFLGYKPPIVVPKKIKIRTGLPPLKPGKWSSETRGSARYWARPEPSRPLSEIDPRSDDFLRGYQWRKLRMEVLKARGRRCDCCGAVPSIHNQVQIHVDHIKPRKLFPSLALEFSNLQILCGDCNHGKGNWDQTDWRETEPLVSDADPLTEQPCWAPHVTPFKAKR